MSSYLLSEQSANGLRKLLTAREDVTSFASGADSASASNEIVPRALPFSVRRSNSADNGGGAWLVFMPYGSIQFEGQDIHPAGLANWHGEWYVIDDEITDTVWLHLAKEPPEEGEEPRYNGNCAIGGFSAFFSEEDILPVARVEIGSDDVVRVTQLMVGEYEIKEAGKGGGGGGGGNVPPPPTPYYQWEEVEVVIKSEYDNATRKFVNTIKKIWCLVDPNSRGDNVFTATPLVQ